MIHVVVEDVLNLHVAGDLVCVCAAVHIRRWRTWITLNSFTWGLLSGESLTQRETESLAAPLEYGPYSDLPPPGSEWYPNPTALKQKQKLFSFTEICFPFTSRHGGVCVVCAHLYYIVLGALTRTGRSCVTHVTIYGWTCSRGCSVRCCHIPCPSTPGPQKSGSSLSRSLPLPACQHEWQIVVKGQAVRHFETHLGLGRPSLK